MNKPEFPPPPDDDDLEKLAQVSEEAMLPESHDPAMPIGGNIRCVFCGYNLYTIRRGGLCPECGKPAAGSLHGDAYAYRDPKFVRLLAWGATMIAWLPAGWFTVCLLVLLNFGGRYTSSVILTLAWTIMLGLLFAAGMWLLTIREKRDESPEAEPGNFWRWIARIGGIVHGLTQISWIVVALILGYGPSTRMAEGFMMFAWIAGNALSLSAVAPWMSRVAKRTYQRGLPQAIFVACVAPGALLFVLTLWIAANSFLRNTAFARTMNMFNDLGICLWFAAAFMCLPLFVWAWYRVAGALGRAATLARVHEKYPDARVKL